MPLLSKLSYWIGQALDNSGSTHPPGWVAFQRWSATASQWQAQDAADAANAATWQTRANTAYDSGTWGTGNTWQTDYNNELAAYNAEVTAYNNALAPASVDTVDTGVISASGDTGANNWTTLGGVVTDRSGQWLVTFRGTASNFASGGNAGYRLNMPGVGVADTGTGGSGWSADIGLYWQGSLNSGVSISMQYFLDNQGFGGSISGHLRATFIPTQANPH